MSQIICNGKSTDEKRPGWAVQCPKCHDEIRYTVLNVEPGIDIYLFCENSSDFCLRDEDREEVLNLATVINDEVNKNLLKEVYQRLEISLPSCKDKGQFKIWSNAKCSNCGYEFPYNNGVRNEDLRFKESKIVWVEGAIAYRGGRRPSNRLAKVII